MPNLPLDFPEPILATYGIMLFPEDERTALAYAAQRLGKPLKLYIDAGDEIPNNLVARILGASAFPVDIQDRRWGGSVTGEMLKVYGR